LGSHEAFPSLDEKGGELVGEKGEDYVIIAAEALRRINRQEEIMIGTRSFLIWFNSGRAVGKTDGRRFAPLMETVEINELAPHIRNIYVKHGWGEVELGGIDLAKRGVVLSSPKLTPGEGDRFKRAQILVRQGVRRRPYLRTAWE
jgi:hypothetical protein